MHRQAYRQRWKLKEKERAKIENVDEYISYEYIKRE